MKETPLHIVIEPEKEVAPKDFISSYLRYSSGTECPQFFHRWCAITCLGAYLGRDVFFKQGHFRVHPNLFVMLVGDAGTKKSTAIKMSARLLKLAGYDNFAAKKTRQEKFLLDMAEQAAGSEGLGDGADILEQNLWGDGASDYNVAESFIAADEFNNFIGQGNTDFMSILGDLWDWGEDVYDYKLKNSKSVYLNKPTVSILGGNTPTGVNMLFPPDAIGQGFFSRLIFIQAESTGVKQTWMPLPDEELEQHLVKELQGIKEVMMGEIRLTKESDALLHKIYHSWRPLEDPRFSSYSNRRFPILLKLLIIICANNKTLDIGAKEVIYANTLLTFAERTMPDALGEFGKGKHSAVTHKIVKLIDTAIRPMETRDIWGQVYNDLEKREQLFEIMSNLMMAEKVQLVNNGYLPRKEVIENVNDEFLDWSILSEDELGEHK